MTVAIALVFVGRYPVRDHKSSVAKAIEASHEIYIGNLPDERQGMHFRDFECCVQTMEENTRLDRRAMEEPSGSNDVIGMFALNHR